VIVGVVIFRLYKQASDKPPLSCPACSYPVKGISTLNCPECGADFREVGITPGDQAGKHRKLVSIVVGSVVAVIAAIALAALLPSIM
jgi:DNA-directed RNA polymerase subunit RPC12/RpoP